MTRVLSALVLLPIVVATIWFLGPLGTLVLAEVVVLLAFAEYAGLASRLGARFPKAVTGSAVVVTCGALGWAGGATHVVLMAATITVGTITVGVGRRGADALHDVSAALFALLYLGLPLGAMVAIRVEGGRETLLLLLVCVMMSDTAQYYGGRAFGRRLLAPAISPKKTIEGSGRRARGWHAGDADHRRVVAAGHRASGPCAAWERRWSASVSWATCSSQGSSAALV